MVLPPLQTTSSEIAFTWPDGFTITVSINETLVVTVPIINWEIDKTTLVVGALTVIVPTPVEAKFTVWFAPPFIE